MDFFRYKGKMHQVGIFSDQNKAGSPWHKSDSPDIWSCAAHNPWNMLLNPRFIIFVRFESQGCRPKKSLSKVDILDLARPPLVDMYENQKLGSYFLGGGIPF